MKTFKNYHPICLAIYFFCVLIIAMFVSNPILQISSMIFSILFCTLQHKRSEILSDIGFYSVLFILIAITNPLFSHNGVTPLFFLNEQAITLEAIIYGIAIAVMIISVILWCKSLSSIMTTDKVLYLFGRLIPKLSLVLSMTLCFIPQFKIKFKQIKNAQKAMGVYNSKSRFDRIAANLKIFSSMISFSLENSLDTSLSMKARGYKTKKRTNYSIFIFSSNDITLLLLTLIFFAVVILGVALKQTAFWYYPSISEINTSVLAIITYSAYTLLCLMPSFLEIKENIKWKYYISRI